MSKRTAQAFTAVVCILLIVPTGAAASGLFGPFQGSSPIEDQQRITLEHRFGTDSPSGSLPLTVSQVDDPEASNNSSDSSANETEINGTASDDFETGLNSSANDSNGTASGNATNSSNASAIGGSLDPNSPTGVVAPGTGGAGGAGGGPQPINIPQRVGGNNTGPANGSGSSGTTSGSGGGSGTNTSGGSAAGNGTANASGGSSSGNNSSESGSNTGLAPSAASDASPGAVGGTSQNSSVWGQLDSTGKSGFNVGKSVVDWLFREWLTSQMRLMFNDLLSAMIGFLVGTPFPTNSGGYGIFGTPTNEPWQAFFNQVYVPIVFTLSIALIVMMTLLQGAEAALSRSLPWRTPTPEEMASRAIGAFMIVCSWWWVGTLMAKFVNGVGRFIAPSAPELTGSLEGLLQVGSAGVLTILFTATLGAGEMATLAVLYAIRHALVLVYIVVMPLLLVPALVAPHPKIRGFFGDLAWHYITVLILVLPGAVLMRLGFEASWDFGFAGLGGLLVSLGFFGAGIFAVMLVTWTSVSTKRLASKATSAAEPATDRVDSSFDEASERASEQATRAKRYAQKRLPYVSDPNVGEDVEDTNSSYSTSSGGLRFSGDVTVTTRDQRAD